MQYNKMIMDNLGAEINFSARMETLRANSGLSKSEFCQKMGVTPQAYSKYMQGRIPTTEVICSLIKNFGVNAHWLLTGEGAMFVDRITGYPVSGELPSSRVYSQEYVLGLFEKLERSRDELKAAHNETLRWKSRFEEMLDHALKLDMNLDKLLSPGKQEEIRKDSGGNIG